MEYSQSGQGTKGKGRVGVISIGKRLHIEWGVNGMEGVNGGGGAI